MEQAYIPVYQAYLVNEFKKMDKLELGKWLIDKCDKIDTLGWNAAYRVYHDKGAKIYDYNN